MQVEKWRRKLGLISKFKSKRMAGTNVETLKEWAGINGPDSIIS